LASLPAALVDLDVSWCDRLTAAASFTHLQALRVLDCTGTLIGDACVATFPPSLVELQLNHCACITAAAAMDHLPALKGLGNRDTGLSAATLAACRARGCYCHPVATLRGHARPVRSLTPLPGDRLASGDEDGVVRVWDVAGGVDTGTGTGRPGVLKPHGGVCAWAGAAAPHARAGCGCVQQLGRAR
jgi:WD40 repeat protein